MAARCVRRASASVGTAQMGVAQPAGSNTSTTHSRAPWSKCTRGVWSLGGGTGGTSPATAGDPGGAAAGRETPGGDLAAPGRAAFGEAFRNCFRTQQQSLTKEQPIPGTPRAVLLDDVW